MWKDVPVLLFPQKQVGKGGTQAWKSTTTPPLSSSVPPNDVKRILAVFCLPVQGVHISQSKFSTFSGGRNNGRGGGGGEVDFRACLSSLFSVLLGKNNTGTSFHITQDGLRSLGGFWHTWKFNAKCHLCHSNSFFIISHFLGKNESTSDSSAMWLTSCLGLFLETYNKGSQQPLK